MQISVIIPTLNEERVLPRTLCGLAAPGLELIVVDGGSRDRTCEIALRHACRVLPSDRGRGVQQHRGACHAAGEILLFLHADTRLPGHFQALLHKTFRDPRVTFAAFRLGIDPAGAALNLVALGANLRSRFLRLPYGDQGLCVRRGAYFETGGFRDWPIMEDVDLVRRLKKTGRFVLMPARVRTSARRWKKEGVLYTTLRNGSLMFRYWMGESPHRLHPLYRDAR